MGFFSELLDFLFGGKETDYERQQRIGKEERDNAIAEEKQIGVSSVGDYIQFEGLLKKAEEYYDLELYESAVDCALPVYDAKDRYGYEYAKTDTYKNQRDRAENLLERVSDTCMEKAHEFIDLAQVEYDADRQDESDFKYYLRKADEHIDIAEKSKCGDQYDVTDAKYDSNALYQKGADKTYSKYKI